jgi:hypothetical protein
MDNDLYRRITALEADVRRLKGRVRLLGDSTLPIKPINLRTILAAHLMQLGFSPQSQSRIQYIRENTEVIAAALGMQPRYVERFFEYAFLISAVSESPFPSFTICIGCTALVETNMCMLQLPWE